MPIRRGPQPTLRPSPTSSRPRAPRPEGMVTALQNRMELRGGGRGPRNGVGPARPNALRPRDDALVRRIHADEVAG
jgi:hypothetical protein